MLVRELFNHCYQCFIRSTEAATNSFDHWSFSRIRHYGEHQMHNKVVLLIVVVLNVIDCLLVMGELILDFHYVSHDLHMKLDMLESFIHNMKQKHTPELNQVPGDPKKSSVLLQKVLDANVFWTKPPETNSFVNRSSKCEQFLNFAGTASRQQMLTYLEKFSDVTELAGCSFQNLIGEHPVNSTSNETSVVQRYLLSTDGATDPRLEVVAHKLHYISISILSVLVIILLVKIFCSGLHFFQSKMQVFDGVIVIVSFVLDLVFVKGVTILDIDDFVVILTILLPWRVIRVLNSLLVAVLDKQRLNLKIMYTQKKKISRTLTDTSAKVDVMQKQIQALKSLHTSCGCILSEDIPGIRPRTRTLPLKYNPPKNTSQQKRQVEKDLSGLTLEKLVFQTSQPFAQFFQYNGDASIHANLQETVVVYECQPGDPDIAANPRNSGGESLLNTSSKEACTHHVPFESRNGNTSQADDFEVFRPLLATVNIEDLPLPESIV